MEQGLIALKDLKTMNDGDIKQLLTGANVGVLFKKKFIKLAASYKNGEYNPQNEEKKEEKEEGDIVDISPYLGKEKLDLKDVKEFITCAACKGGGWFDSSGPCKSDYHYKKCKCGCCDGSGKMPKDFKQCWRCQGKGNYDGSGLCYAGYQYKKKECPLCGGGCYFSLEKFNKLKNNGTRNTKCGTCKGQGSFDGSGPCLRGYQYWKAECTACDGSLLIIDHFSKCAVCKGMGYFDGSGPCHIGYQYKKATCSACDGKAYIDLKDMYKCPVCKGNGSFDSSGPCHRGYQYRKAACTCCDGKCFISKERKNRCGKCKGQGHFDSSGPCHVGYQYRKKTCEDCGGKGYLADK